MKQDVDILLLDVEEVELECHTEVGSAPTMYTTAIYSVDNIIFTYLYYIYIYLYLYYIYIFISYLHIFIFILYLHVQIHKLIPEPGNKDNKYNKVTTTSVKCVSI